MAQIEFDFRKVHPIYNKNTTFTGKCTNFLPTNAKRAIKYGRKADKTQV